VLGRIEEGDARIARLEEAVAVLAPSAFRVEHATALHDLGAAHRRAGQRAKAREPLRHALDIADRVGATRLASAARQELLAAVPARPAPRWRAPRR
jgi:Tfp pilus assembly protein PilF